MRTPLAKTHFSPLVAAGIRASGFIAWVMWLGIHIIQLIGFRNKLFVLLNWAWDYFFYERAARLITRD